MEPKPEQKQPMPPQNQSQGPSIAQVQFEQLIAQKLADANRLVLTLNDRAQELQKDLETTTNASAHLAEENKRLVADNEALRKIMAPEPEKDLESKG